MTQEDLSHLDEELKSGYVSDEEYAQILKDEVSRIHPEFEDYEIENMIRVQLKVNAIEESLISELNEIPDRPEMSSAPQHIDKCDKDCDQHECNSSQQEGELNSQENVDQQESQQESEQTEKQENTKEDVNSQSSDKESESGRSDKHNGNNNQNKNDKNVKKDKSKGGGNRAWVTYQIVPEQVLFGDNAEDNEES